MARGVKKGTIVKAKAPKAPAVDLPLCTVREGMTPGSMWFIGEMLCKGKKLCKCWKHFKFDLTPEEEVAKLSDDDLRQLAWTLIEDYRGRIAEMETNVTAEELKKTPEEDKAFLDGLQAQGLPSPSKEKELLKRKKTQEQRRARGLRSDGKKYVSSGLARTESGKLFKTVSQKHREAVFAQISLQDEKATAAVEAQAKAAAAAAVAEAKAADRLFGAETVRMIMGEEKADDVIMTSSLESVLENCPLASLFNINPDSTISEDQTPAQQQVGALTPGAQTVLGGDAEKKDDYRSRGNSTESTEVGSHRSESMDDETTTFPGTPECTSPRAGSAAWTYELNGVEHIPLSPGEAPSDYPVYYSAADLLKHGLTVDDLNQAGLPAFATVDSGAVLGNIAYLTPEEQEHLFSPNSPAAVAPAAKSIVVQEPPAEPEQIVMDGLTSRLEDLRVWQEQ